MKTFLNNIKKSVIPPLFYKKNFATDFKDKTGRFNFCFAKQSPFIKNDSKLFVKLNFLTAKRLPDVRFSNTDILRIIQNLDSKQGHDKISIRLLTVCGKSICRTLKFRFKDWPMAYLHLI